ncbi:hypothetical protein H8S77_19045 [Parabacteroides sp. BX2]|uniref:Helix-turn-helix domain-containing protein n=1 Tax=Parabacteroides segnis TaxID=2763058 RepID=A0ABR7E7B5_9BACT|nr:MULTISPECIES: hypothetical protein [Parabacteroides]MBC5644979.1 hypothetical protein [Parabacteroides segnis]MCM0712682.1 hypothetical protein [Parabacteroides sp. TA-V-105]
MTKCNENMTPGYRKSGYLKVGRNVLKAFFGSDKEQRHLSQVLLCVQTFAYFRDGMVCLNEFTYTCHAGEWITSFSEIADLTGLCRKSVKKCLGRLEAGHFLQVRDLLNYKLISLTNYEQIVQVSNETNQPSSPSQSSGNEPEGDFFSQAMCFYQPTNTQEGGVN